MKRYSFRVIIAGIKEDIQGICNFLGKDDKFCKDLRESVKIFESRFQVFAAWLSARNIEPEEYVIALQKYIDSKRLDPSKIKVSKSAIQINDDKFEDALEFTEYIHANYPVMQVEKQQNKEITEDVPVVANKDNSIQIFEIDSANDGRRLVGNDTKWCIGYPGPNNMWQSYRDLHDASFFVVVDNNPPTPDQRKVAVDFTGNNQVLLTDIPNRTGRTLSNGMNWDEYSRYLKSKGINLEATRENSETGEEELILKNKPRTPEEIIQSAVFSEIREMSLRTLKEWQSGFSEADISIFQNDFYEEYIKPNVDQTYSRNYVHFKNPEAKYYTARWMSLGKQVEIEVFDFLMNSVGGMDIIAKYVNTGMQIKDQEIYERIKSNKQLFTSYLRSRVNAADQSPANLTKQEFTDLKELGRKDLLLAYVNTGKCDFSDIKDDPELAKLHIDAKLEKNDILDYYEVEYVFFVDKNEDNLAKVLEQNDSLNEERYNAIKDNPRLFGIALSKASHYGVVPHWIKDARTRIFNFGDANLVKIFAVKYGFGADEIKLAKQFGDDLENAAKFSVLMHRADSEIVELFNPENPNDVSIVSQFGGIKLAEPFLYDERWRDNPVLSWANDFNYAELILDVSTTLDDRKTVNNQILPENPTQMLLFFIVHSGEMPSTVFQDLRLEDEDSEKLRRVYLEFSSAINTLDFWHDFIKNFSKFKNNGGFVDFSTSFTILEFIPEQFLEDETILEFISKNNFLNQNKSFLSKIDFSRHPKLFDLLVEKSKNNFSVTLGFLGQHSKDLYIKKKLENDKSSIKYLENIGILSTSDRFKIVEVYLSLYPEERDRLHKTNPEIITFLLYNKVNIGYQLWLLRNIPEAVKDYVSTTANLKDFAPEVRASMKQMFPNLAYKIDFYEQNKYGTGGYFDEETEEVVQAPRPEPKPVSDEEMFLDLQKIIQNQDPFAPDDEDEDEPVVASVNLMVKIAQKLDFKKNYKLADKFTNILRKYNV